MMMENSLMASDDQNGQGSGKQFSKKRNKIPLLVLCANILLLPWLYDHGMLPQLPRTENFWIGEMFPAALPLCIDYIANPIWQLHGVQGSGHWFRSFQYSCEFNTSEKVILKKSESWTTGNGVSLPQNADDLLPPNILQGIKRSQFDYWFIDRYPSETTMLLRKKGSDQYYLFSDGAG
ncbi:MAG: hypothetical protein JST01_05045 [Cyanobacteria bacterium SZAS TMP-1]|nr:hypothetical protein [Cyanobacteria bacterium SZAS TMP-1]